MSVWFRTVIPFALLAAAIWLFQWRRDQKRKSDLKNIASGLGLVFEAKDWGPRNLAPHLGSRHFINSYAQSFRNSMSGHREGLYASFFDHNVEGRSGHTDTIASFTQSISLPEFTLTSQDAIDRIGDAIFHRQIEFPSDPAFSEHFHLAGPDEDRVRELFAPNMREFLNGIGSEWRIEASGNTLLLYQVGYSVKPSEYSDFVDETTQIAKDFFSNCHLKHPAF